MLLFFVAACAARSDPTSFARTRSLDQQELSIEVENRNFSDATVYAFHGGYRLRLGRVTGKTTETFTFRWEAQELRMIIDFTGAGELLSDEVAVDPGVDDNLLLIIGSRRSLWMGRRG